MCLHAECFAAAARSSKISVAKGATLDAKYTENARGYTVVASKKGVLNTATSAPYILAADMQPLRAVGQNTGKTFLKTNRR